MASYAQVLNGVVANWIPNVTDDDLQQLESLFPEYEYCIIPDGVSCNIGDYYNPADGLYYQDPEFKWISGIIIPPSTDEAYAAAVKRITEYMGYVLGKIKSPYTDAEAQTWWCQYHEAEEWTANNNYVPVMLNAMVSNSGGKWDLATLAANILSNAAAWKAGVGEALGKQRVVYSDLEEIKAGMIAGTKTYLDMQNYDVEFAIPEVSIVDKFA